MFPLRNPLRILVWKFASWETLNFSFGSWAEELWEPLVYRFKGSMKVMLLYVCIFKWLTFVTATPLARQVSKMSACFAFLLKSLIFCAFLHSKHSQHTEHNTHSMPTRMRGGRYSVFTVINLTTMAATVDNITAISLVFFFLLLSD